MDGSPSTAYWQPVQESLRRLRVAGEAFERFTHGRLEELSRLAAHLDHRRQELDLEQQSLKQQQRDWQTRVSAEQEQSQALAATIDHLHLELTASQAALAEAQSLLEDQRELTATADNVQRNLQLQLQAAQSQSATLHAELETWQRLATHSEEAAAVEKRHAAEERARWTAETHALRQALEAQAQRLASMTVELDAQEAAVEAPDRGPAKPNTSKSNMPRKKSVADPVLDAVLAQFETLQKGRARPARKK